MKNQDINVDDEAVKDRWSRYIGAMGIEAVAKQAAANIFLSARWLQFKNSQTLKKS